MKAEGKFVVSMQPEPPYHEASGVTLARAAITKQFEGPLTATSTVHMLAARTATANSAGYVACERVEGVLDGRRGSFVAMHLGLMDRGQNRLQIDIVPDSGTDELTGLRGTMAITIVDGQHCYVIDYDLPAG